VKLPFLTPPFRNNIYIYIYIYIYINITYLVNFSPWQLDGSQGNKFEKLRRVPFG